MLSAPNLELNWFAAMRALLQKTFNGGIDQRRLVPTAQPIKPAPGMALTAGRLPSFWQSSTKRLRALVRAGLCWITGMDDGSRARLARRPRLPVHLMFADTEANRQLYGDRFIDDMNRDRRRTS